MQNLTLAISSAHGGMRTRIAVRMSRQSTKDLMNAWYGMLLTYFLVHNWYAGDGRSDGWREGGRNGTFRRQLHKLNCEV